jgi:DNA-binding NtrC family response regulator
LGKNQNASVLLVDDEDMVLTSVRAYLTLETEFTIHTYSEPEEAVKYMQANPVDVVVSDYLMPRMSGIQFLMKARELQPEVSRVLLTGHADKHSAIQAINDVGLYQYVEKPWDNAQLLLVVTNGIERSSLLRDLRSTIAELATANTSLKDVQKRMLRAFL